MKKKMLTGLLILFFLLLAGAAVLYNAAVGPLRDDEERAIDRAKKEAGLEAVVKTDWFHYQKAYIVILGKTDSGEKAYFFVPREGKGTIFVEKTNRGLSEKEAIDLLYNGLDTLSDDKRPKQILRIKPGVLDDFPVYEITYRDRKNRYSIIYIDFYEGEWYRVYNL
jgi:hypothetical protein